MFLGDMLRAAGRGDETAARQVRSTFVVVAVTLVPICYIGYVGEGGRYVLTYWAALATFGVALRARRYFEGRGPVQRVLNFLGAISYSVYLLHAPVGLALGAATLAATDSRILAFFATMASTIGAGYLSYRLVELPFLALGKKLAARPVKTAPAPAAVTAGGSGA
jgi:peptidoglycan/LPS O-acetylase OafA/YrhL